MIRILLGTCALLCLSGCSGLAYYGQAVQGQWQLLTTREPVSEVLTQELSAEVREGLLLSQDILAFAEQHVGLVADGRYETYVQLQDTAVVWNVFAAPELELQAYEWCYPIVGCAPYRGYFKQQAALDYARNLETQGWETYVGGVPAYSTLGWFDDPLLSSFITWPAGDLANLLLHELAHGRVWVASDVTFNENFASFVGEQATAEWMLGRDDTDGAQALAQWRQARASWQRMRSLLLEFKDALHTQLALAPEAAAAGQEKARLYGALQDCYRQHRQTLGSGRYDRLLDRVNNAYLVSLGAYADWQGAFRQLYLEADSRWSAFFEAVDALAELPPAQRAARLEALTRSAEQQEHADADHADTEQVHCEAFAGHGGH